LVILLYNIIFGSIIKYEKTVLFVPFLLS